MTQSIVSRWLSLGFVLLGGIATANFLAPVAVAAGGDLEFNRDIRPILSDHCFACHGFDSKTRKAGLRLDLAEEAYKADDKGFAAISPGKIEQSTLWQRINATDPDDVMPPPSTHKTLTAEQKETLRQWIEQGAKFQKHWAFEAPVNHPVPKAPSSAVIRQPLDAFIASKLESFGLSQAPEANRETLIRRVTFSLTGLPPTPAEVDAFVSDTESGAYERLVERLLTSPRFGEEMARHWLDVARYADTHGLHLDNERQMWAYRDWVVGAFNRNLPFDQFTIEQLAGDLLPEPSRDQLIATGFNRCNVTTSEGGSINDEYIFRYAVERASTTVQTWMGLTAGCAVCHDHKFDPISAREFYQFYAFFHSSADPAMDGNALLTAPVIKLPGEDHEEKMARLTREIEAVEGRMKEHLATFEYTDPATLDPRPPVSKVESVWMEDEAPAGSTHTASPGAPPNFVTAPDNPVFSGARSLRRQDAGLAQDVIEGGTVPIDLPDNARLFAHVYLEPTDMPRAIMLQYKSSDWKHRVVWGDYDVINWGARDTTERVHQGALPEAGKWVRLEFDADVVGLKSGTRITGFAMTQHGGTVYWDNLGVVGRNDPAGDPGRSFIAWQQRNQGKELKELPGPLQKALREFTAEERSLSEQRQLRDYFLGRVCSDTRPDFDPFLTEMEALRKERAGVEQSIPATFVWKDLEKPRQSYIMLRGAYDKPGDPVEPGVLDILPPLEAPSRPNRLDLATWLMSSEHPLTARVAVNRLWQQFFGTGLVASSDDFGTQGELPSHPELLDWLAIHFRDTGWDMKAFVREIVTSATFRQDAQVTPDILERDPDNRWLARGPRFRLDAEQIRDNALFVSGLMDFRMGGKGVKPYQPPNIWEPVGFVGSNTRDYKRDTGPDLYRRSLYTFFKRTAPPPFMSSFDAPNREQSCSRRERSNTPLQALQLMNDVQHFEAARALAERLLMDGGASSSERIRTGFRIVLARTPHEFESAILLEALGRHLERYSRDPEAAQLAITFGESAPKPGLPPAEVAAWTLVANLLLNLDETLNRN